MRKNIGNYVIGLDIGIGSVGWAVVRMDSPRIERFGVDIFDSGENTKRTASLSQERRGFRAVRRLTRRKSHRKMRLKYYLDKVGFCKIDRVNRYFEENSKNVIELRVRALDEKILPEEVLACLIHVCNMRGYADFYERTEEDDKEEQEDKQGVDIVRSMLKNYRTVAEMYWKDETFANGTSEFRSYRNRTGLNRHLLAPRDALEGEVDRILAKQREFYPILTEEVVQNVKTIIFSQRSFEEGPGNPNDQKRKYKGFLDTIGKCSFYKDEERGQRYTFLSDLYSLVNAISQYQFFNADGERDFSGTLARDLLEYAAKNGAITVKEIKKIAENRGFKILSGKTEKNSPIAGSLKYLKSIKRILMNFGFDWEALVAEAFDNRENSFLQRLGILLSSYITPRKRREMLPTLPEIKTHAQADALTSALVKIKCSGTERVSYRYMNGAIDAFLGGDIYGKYQAKKIEELNKEETTRFSKLPPFGKEFEFYDNPVVMRSINETRKIINRIVEEYGSPYAINLEIGTELNKSYENRKKETDAQAKNEKNKIAVRKAIAELIGKAEDDVSPAEIERYILGEQQGWKCLYSGRSIDDKKAAILNANKAYEVDHIIPFSLILDNTLNNKVLVYASENQSKRQRTPLEYLNGEKKSNYLKLVNTLYPKQINKTKYAYLMARSDSELIEGWKSRNLNDTRYISKFLEGYLSQNLEFAPRDPNLPYRARVYGVRGAITSQMRKYWLNEETWGIANKEQLKKVTYLDHAADAIVVANCLPVYVELNVVRRRLYQILGANKGMRTEEYLSILERAKEYIHRFYGMSYERIERYLTARKGYEPSLIPNLRQEVDVRLVDSDIFRIFDADRCDRHGLERRTYTDEEIEQIFRKGVEEFYRDDLDFARSLKMPFTVHKSDRKARGKITDSNPVRVVDGKELSPISVMKLKKDDLNNLYSGDRDLIESLQKAFMEADKKTELGKLLGKEDNEVFVTEKGTKVRRVTLAKTAKRTLKKQIGENNYTLLNDAKYYCIEIYKDKKDYTRLTGISYSDLKLKNGKLWLNERYRNPTDYASHIMYLFPGDFIRIYDKAKKLNFEGYYKSVCDISTNRLFCLKNNTPQLKKDDSNKVSAFDNARKILKMKKGICINKNDSIEKYEVDLLGEIKGKVKCGEPLSSIRENE